MNEDFLRDTVNVPYYNGRSLAYPSVRVRMDFRDPNIVGTFVYHCHLLEHEDKGMMGSIRVDPASPPRSENNAAAQRATLDNAKSAHIVRNSACQQKLQAVVHSNERFHEHAVLFSTPQTIIHRVFTG